MMLSTLPHFNFCRKTQLCKGLGKIRCFFVCFFKYIWHFYNYQSNSTFVCPLSNLNCCVCQLFLILLMKQNSADNANREIEAYTDLGLGFQKSTAPQLGPDFKRSLILFSNKINSQIFKRFQHFGNLIIRSSCWAHLQTQPRMTCSLSREECGRARNRALYPCPRTKSPVLKKWCYLHVLYKNTVFNELFVRKFNQCVWGYSFQNNTKIYTQGR